VEGIGLFQSFFKQWVRVQCGQGWRGSIFFDFVWTYNCNQGWQSHQRYFAIIEKFLMRYYRSSFAIFDFFDNFLRLEKLTQKAIQSFFV